MTWPYLGLVARSLVSAKRWLRGIKMYRFPWYLTLVSTNHASSNPGLSARVTLARGLPYLPCKHSARDNLLTWDNFTPSCMTSNHANLNSIIQFLSLIINIWKIKSYFLSTMIIFSLFFFRELTCFPWRTSRLFQVLDCYKECHAWRNTSAKLVKLTQVIG